jgi:quinohemoprotein ethanol dehydrogenase
MEALTQICNDVELSISVVVLVTGRILLCAVWLVVVVLLQPATLAAAPVDGERIKAAASTEWLSHGRGYDEQRFSPLQQIDRDSVSKLGLAWKMPTGNSRGMEATPIVADGVMYVSTAWSRVVALDARTGRELWRYDPKVPGAKGRDACCDVVNRGVAVWQDKVFIGALDGRLIALARDTGRKVWSVQTTDTDKPYTITGAPRVVKGKVIIGNGGAEYGVRGYFSAYDANTGKQLWRFYTVPGEDPAEDAQQPHLVAARRTWSPDSLWEVGLGGTVWDSFAFDPELNLLYVGVGNSSQYNRAMRSPGGGDNLYLASILAVNPDTGALVWHYQTTPAEAWDYTATQHMILAELDILGERRKVIMQAPKNGFFYVLDRQTGELLSAKNYVYMNWASHVDLETGRPVETEAADWSQGPKMISPSMIGGHNWHPMSFSPATGLVYVPTIHTAFPFTPDPDFQYNPNTWNTGEDWVEMTREMPSVAVSFCSPTRLTAWDPVEQTMAWQVKFSSDVSAGTLATAGGLVFQGTTAGELVAYRDDTGDRLWGQQVNIGIMAPPISYELDGEQYIAVVAGIGGAQGIYGEALSNQNSGHVFAFKLGGTEPPPELIARSGSISVDDSMLDEASVEHGRELYVQHCLRCHGPSAQSTGLFPDLRHSSPGVHKIWQQIVYDGALSGNGMASFSDVLSPDDINAVHSYVISEALFSDSLSGRVLQGLASKVCIPAEWMTD